MLCIIAAFSAAAPSSPNVGWILTTPHFGYSSIPHRMYSSAILDVLLPGPVVSCFGRAGSVDLLGSHWNTAEVYLDVNRCRSSYVSLQLLSIVGSIFFTSRRCRV